MGSKHLLGRQSTYGAGFHLIHSFGSTEPYFNLGCNLKRGARTHSCRTRKMRHELDETKTTSRKLLSRFNLERARCRRGTVEAPRHHPVTCNTSGTELHNEHFHDPQKTVNDV